MRLAASNIASTDAGDTYTIHRELDQIIVRYEAAGALMRELSIPTALRRL